MASPVLNLDNHRDWRAGGARGLGLKRIGGLDGWGAGVRGAGGLAVEVAGWSWRAGGLEGCRVEVAGVGGGLVGWSAAKSNRCAGSRSGLKAESVAQVRLCEDVGSRVRGQMCHLLFSARCAPGLDGDFGGTQYMEYVA